MAYSNSNTKVVPEAREALDKFKYEVASDVGVKKLFKKITIFLHLKLPLFIKHISLLSYFFCLWFCIVPFLYYH